MLAFFFAAFASLAPAVGVTLVDEATVAHIRRFRADERLATAHASHESRVSLHEDAEGRPVVTDRAVLLISGLFNSPRAMLPLEESFFGRGYNVVNLRLAGHYEKDTSVLREHIRWSTWREQSQAAFELARALGGDAVILAGHSTGALLSAWLAVDHPEAVAGLALFAPAFRLSETLDHVLNWPEYASGVAGLAPPYAPGVDPQRVHAANAKLYFKTMRGRTITLHAGREVRDLGFAFTEATGPDCDASLARAGERLRRISLWMGNTGFDRIIDLGAAAQFFAAVARDGEAPRHHHRLGVGNLIPHDNLVSGRHWRWNAMLRSMNRTLFH